MIGESREAPTLKTKGAETFGLLIFLVEQLGSVAVRIPDHDALKHGGQHILDLIGIWQGASWRLTPAELQASFRAFNSFADATAGVPGIEIPKRHLSVHLLKDTAFLGNPRFYSNWLDESLNKLLKQVCRGISQATFDCTVLSAMQRLLPDRCGRPVY